MTDNKYWLYLETLRRSGVTNMFGASPYLQQEFRLSHEEAAKILTDWMKNYNPDDYKKDGGDEISRPCVVCGLPVSAGMTDDYGSFYCHERCFEKYMDDTYGKHEWMKLGNGEEDGCGGFYIHTADVVGGYEGTGVYYTEYDDEDEGDEC